MDLDLKGKNAIVTGGTRGIGRAIAELLAAEGCNVALCARHEAAVDATVAALAARGVKSWGGRVDVGEIEGLRGWVATAADVLGGLDILVANVSALAQSMDDDSWRRSLEIDIMGTVAGVEAAIPFLEKSQASAIVDRRHDRCDRDCRSAAALRVSESGAGAVCEGSRAQSRRQEYPRQYGLSRQCLFQGRGVEHPRTEQPGAVQDHARAQPDGPHGNARGLSPAPSSFWRARAPASSPAPT